VAAPLRRRETSADRYSGGRFTDLTETFPQETGAMHYRNSRFSRFANWTARTSGHPAAFVIAVLVILVWAITGPIFAWSDTWQLVINTGTTIVTFLMVFLIQNTQNRDSHAVQLKLDELIRAVEGAHNALLDIEELNEKELVRLRQRYVALAAQAREELKQGRRDTDSRELDPD
jgi:low affinity Fe/Cu permease